MKVDILAVGVHPDDVELSCVGTLLKHIDLGYTVGLCDLTKGELGTRGNATIRLAEAEESRKIIGAIFRENLEMEDGFFEHSEVNIKKIATIIRKYQPEIVFANAVHDRHPDHGRAARLISDACFFSGLVKIKLVDQEGVQLAPWRPRAVYHYIQDRNMKPDFVVDISAYMDKKFETILAFNSQFYTLNSDEPETPISSKSFMDFIRSKNQSMARDINTDYAEGFTVDRTIGVDDVFQLR